MNIRHLTAAAALALLLAAAAPADSIAQAAADAARPHKVVFQVSDGDPAKWSLALNNVRNVQQDLGKEKVAVEIVAYGPGIGMLKIDSTVASRIAEALGAGVSVVACENTMKNQKLVRDDMLPRIGYVDAGVVQLMKRQQEGWAYIRP